MVKFTNNKLTLILVLVLTVLLVSGGTFAYFQWQSSLDDKTNVIVSVTDNIEMRIDPAEVTKTGLRPTNNCGGEFAMSGNSLVTIDNNTGILARPRFKLKLKIIDKEGNNITNETSPTGNPYRQYIKYVVTETDGSCTSPLSSGSFNLNTETSLNSGWYESSTLTLNDADGFPALSDGVNTGVSFDAYADRITIHTYKLWIWIDETYTAVSTGNTVNVDKLQDAIITVSWSENSSVEQVHGDGTGSIITPVLDAGMIPVTIANNGAVTTILSTDSNWYDYDNKEWANVVLVDSDSRETYQNTTGVPVNTSDILAYYVWIPRYKYKMNGKEESISIEFESVSSKSNGDAVNTYYTHPAFTFGTQELSGIWVGKFETTGRTDAPTILPNTSPLVYQRVAAQFQTGLLFSGGTLSNGNVSFSGSSTYGLSASTDSHMMKNSEWGAVAYLSHSQYGINGQIRVNNFLTGINQLKTGCGASVEDNTYADNICEIAYGASTLYPQSTTGNITGVFDMSGGAYDSVMGAYSYDNSVPMSGIDGDVYSGFKGILYDGGNYSSISYGVVDLPPSKYYDMYKRSQFTEFGMNNNNMSLCTLETCGGHALSETASWYDDVVEFVHSYGPWFSRGGYAPQNSSAGAFATNNSCNSNSGLCSFRSVLVR